MRYVEFRDKICEELRRVPAGLTWLDVKARLQLTYKIPCPEWIRQMEQEVGLSRKRGPGRAFVWKIPKKNSGRKKRFSMMTTAQLRGATREYDREWSGSGLPGKPLTAGDRAFHRKAREIGGRPRLIAPE